MGRRAHYQGIYVSEKNRKNTAVSDCKESGEPQPSQTVRSQGAMRKLEYSLGIFYFIAGLEGNTGNQKETVVTLKNIFLKD